MKNLQIVAKKDLKFSTVHFLYCFEPLDRKKYLKSSIADKMIYLNQLKDNGNITHQQLVNIILNR